MQVKLTFCFSYKKIKSSWLFYQDKRGAFEWRVGKINSKSCPSPGNGILEETKLHSTDATSKYTSLKQTVHIRVHTLRVQSGNGPFRACRSTNLSIPREGLRENRSSAEESIAFGASSRFSLRNRNFVDRDLLCRTEDKTGRVDRDLFREVLHRKSRILEFESRADKFLPVLSRLTRLSSSLTLV